MGGNIGGRQPTIADHAPSLGWVRRRTTWYRERGIMAGEDGGRAVYKEEITRTLRTVTKRHTAPSSVRACAGLACALRIHAIIAWPARDGSDAIYITSTTDCYLYNSQNSRFRKEIRGPKQSYSCNLANADEMPSSAQSSSTTARGSHPNALARSPRMF